MQWPRLSMDGNATNLTIWDGICCAVARIAGVAHVLFPAEVERTRRIDPDFATLMFSAKEAIYTKLLTRSCADGSVSRRFRSSSIPPPHRFVFDPSSLTAICLYWRTARDRSRSK